MTEHTTMIGTTAVKALTADDIYGPNRPRAPMFSTTGSITSITRAYKSVPWLYRSIVIRAQAVASMPYRLMRDGDDVTDDPEYAGLTLRLYDLLWRTEASLCLVGGSYCLLNDNIAGLNITPQWVKPKSITPKIGGNGEPSSYARLVNFKSVPLRADQVAYVWLPSADVEAGPGEAPAQAAIAAAGVLFALDSFVEQFFRDGAVQTTLLTVETPNGIALSEEDEQKLITRWKRAKARAKSAFDSIMAVSKRVQPIVVGAKISETAAPELSTQKREDIASAIGVPHSMIFSNAANFATAQADERNLYTQTVIPSCLLIQNAWNRQFIGPRMGLRLEFQPERLPVFQAAELERAKALGELVQSGIFTEDEARGKLGMAPKPKPAPATDPNVIDVNPAPSAAAPVPQLGDATALKLADLGKWQRKAIKAVRRGEPALVRFDSDAITLAEANTIAQQLADAADAQAVRAIFNAIGVHADAD